MHCSARGTGVSVCGRILWREEARGEIEKGFEELHLLNGEIADTTQEADFYPRNSTNIQESMASIAHTLADGPELVLGLLE